MDAQRGSDVYQKDDRTLADYNIEGVGVILLGPEDDEELSPSLYDRTLSDNNIQMKSTLHLVLYVRSGIQIFVKTLTVEKITTTEQSLWKVLFRSSIVYRNLVIEHQV